MAYLKETIGLQTKISHPGPSYDACRWLVGAPTTLEMEDTRRRVTACFQAAALASGCKVQITITSTLNEITQNKALARR
ncbi:hypothetical protein CY34DRAFT_800907 [Suillus luteus UH-Slu-Lm8-n1]|uniref:Unplaced genomic scaffold CY34scaffold_33, whole genome shotgun sequence n=1 Tax=Suillus luteus UH-Slu-Lm8-n1 TaxID=930992 RepID=A0A0D0B8B9_9AGAM|nr:hypothetical protein CY34DRAFT_800907 [Suillus luteus UH-Slu-Lm8-n1]